MIVDLKFCLPTSAFLLYLPSPLHLFLLFHSYFRNHTSYFTCLPPPSLYKGSSVFPYFLFILRLSSVLPVLNTTHDLRLTTHDSLPGGHSPPHLPPHLFPCFSNKFIPSSEIILYTLHGPSPLTPHPSRISKPFPCLPA